MKQIQCRARHTQAVLSIVFALAVPVLIFMAMYGPIRVYATVATLHSDASLAFWVLVASFFLSLVMPLVSIATKYPFYVECNPTLIRARYLHSTVVLETSRVIWAGANRSGESFIVLGHGTIIQWIPDDPEGFALCEKYVNSIKKNGHSTSYAPQPLTANMKRIVELLEFAFEPMRFIASIVFAWIMCFLITGFVTHWTALGLITIVPVETLIGMVMFLFGLVYVSALIPAVIVKLGGSWDHLSLLLNWSQFASPNHNIERIILQSMVQNLGQISAGRKALNSVNAVLRTGQSNPIVNDLLPLIPAIGNRATLGELLKLQAGCKMSGTNELLKSEELHLCITQLKTRLNV